MIGILSSFRTTTIGVSFRPSVTTHRPCASLSAKLFETMILTLRGTPFLYQGDELGMTDLPFKKLTDDDDIAIKNAYKAEVETGGRSPPRRSLHRRPRLLATMPVPQCNGTVPPQAGFTTGMHPWLAVNPNYKQINAAQEESDPESV